MTQYGRSQRLLVAGGTDFTSEARRLFGFVATTPLEDRLRRTIDWYVANREAAEAATL